MRPQMILAATFGLGILTGLSPTLIGHAEGQEQPPAEKPDDCGPGPQCQHVCWTAAPDGTLVWALFAPGTSRPFAAPAEDPDQASATDEVQP